MEAKTTWMGEVKETEPVREGNPNSYSEELMAHGKLGYFKILTKLKIL
jgi:hypothetical protein